MTAEIAILNRHGVALATDSAVTIRQGRNQKIYNSVNKLFMLSKYAPVGVMVYGNSDLTGIPWETIIKSFRDEVGDERLPHLSDYGHRLIRFVQDHKLLFSEEHQARQVIHATAVEFHDIKREIDSRLQHEVEVNPPVSESRVKRIVDDTIRSRHHRWTTAERLPGAPPGLPSRIVRKWGERVASGIDRVFERLPVGNASRGRLIQISGSMWTANIFDELSGVVVAGFGEEEFLPCLVAYEVEGVVLNFLKMREDEDRAAAVVAENSATIVPFAQREMVDLFMEGIDPYLRTHVTRALNRYVRGLPDIAVKILNVEGKAEKKVREKAAAAAKSLSDQFLGDLDRYITERHVAPIVTACANLPKEELANMVESLVSLTSFKRRVSRDEETVGGPIDVAVISKGDGFIWIRRKHYFDPRLNYQFFANYYGDGEVIDYGEGEGTHVNRRDSGALLPGNRSGRSGGRRSGGVP